jgi:hypothetical protein
MSARQVSMQPSGAAALAGETWRHTIPDERSRAFMRPLASVEERAESPGEGGGGLCAQPCIGDRREAIAILAAALSEAAAS